MVPIAASTRPQLGSLPKIGGLEEVVARYRATDLDGVLLAGGADHLDADVVARALGVLLQLLGEIAADVDEHGLELGSAAVRYPDAPLASSETWSLVDMQPSESRRSKRDAGRGAQRLIERGAREGRIGRDDDQHRGEAGREHSGALGHAADREPSPRCAPTDA